MLLSFNLNQMRGNGSRIVFFSKFFYQKRHKQEELLLKYCLQKTRSVGFLFQQQSNTALFFTKESIFEIFLKQFFLQMYEKQKCHLSNKKKLMYFEIKVISFSFSIFYSRREDFFYKYISHMSCDQLEQYLVREWDLILEQANPCITHPAQFQPFSLEQARNFNNCSFVQQSRNRNYIQSQQRQIEKGDTHNFLINLKPKIKRFLDRFPECLGNIYYLDWRKKTRKSTSIQQIQTLFLEEELAPAFQKMFVSRYLNREVTMMRLKDCSQKKACLKALQTLQKGFKKRSFTRFW